VELLKSSSCLDLGVLVTSNLSWSEHTSYVVKRANKIVYLLSKTFTKTTLAVTAKLIKSYVRPVLEFGHGVWAPNLKRDIDLLESVQRRATRIPFGRNRPEYSERISLMNLPLLSDRRKRGDVILVHQALTGDKNSSIKQLFPLNDGGRTRGHDLKLAKDNFRTSARQNFITNRVFDVWNSLPVEVVTSKTPLGFKSRYDSYVTSVIK
jgi:ribonuclease P/MRP protein subunit RPP40